MGKGGMHIAQWFIRGVDGKIDLFWVGGQKFLIQSFQAYNTEFYTIWMSILYNDFEYLVRAAKSDIGNACIKDEPKTNCIQHLRGVERIAL